MKNLMIFFVFTFLISSLIKAQKPNDAFYKLFPILEENMDDADIRNLLKTVPPLKETDRKIITSNSYSDFEIIPIGKLETSKAICIVYAGLDDDTSVDRLIRINSIAFDKKTGEAVPASSQSYMTISGKDASHHRAKIEISGKEYRFIHIEHPIGKASSAKITTAVYILGKKYLEFRRYDE
jgi:hypothetical protein